MTTTKILIIIYIIFPAIPLAMGPLVNLLVRMQNNRSPTAPVVNIEMSYACGGEYDDVSWANRNDQTGLIQAQLAVFKVANDHDNT